MKTMKFSLKLSILICLGIFAMQHVYAMRNGDVVNEDSIQMAYPFELKDKDGKLVRMEDFRGKVVVLDFWFKGCVPCMLLGEPLGQIRKYYQSNPEVVFIDINLDDNVDFWLNSLKNGGTVQKKRRHYTDSLSISVSTAPAGFDHEITKYYKFNGVPTLIIINKKGEILERNPPRPLSEKNGIESIGSLKFKMLINEYLLSSSKKSRAQ
ncbi:TlpA family protein disulfide reductase [Sphingobacterium yanglingense]|uniref:Thioredoxin-like protein n=1 Tax=Sphingobacterium yanglingense TaxID=1437280 RepID=A0A4R6WLU8_9SPHI|nr:TlpA disulfide reductase family protein [Sphingobacterium yanglingense]TDQ79305.1 thioredoxin-like protein [Sphingobacterium yanglingense]